MAGKGDTPRPYSTTAFGEGYDRIWRKKTTEFRCKNCSKLTHPAYVDTPNMPCWNCGEPMTSRNEPTPAT